MSGGYRNVAVKFFNYQSNVQMLMGQDVLPGVTLAVGRVGACAYTP